LVLIQESENVGVFLCLGTPQELHNLKFQVLQRSRTYDKMQISCDVLSCIFEYASNDIVLILNIHRVCHHFQDVLNNMDSLFYHLVKQFLPWRVNQKDKILFATWRSFLIDELKFMTSSLWQFVSPLPMILFATEKIEILKSINWKYTNYCKISLGSIFTGSC
jgi:hypothetical protein